MEGKERCVQAVYDTRDRLDEITILLTLDDLLGNRNYVMMNVLRK